jgi:hypothetical protein
MDHCPRLQGNSDADRPGQDNRSMRIPPASTAFTVLLSFLVALPSFGIDMSLPALTETGTALRVTPARAGLMMSLFMVGFAIAPLFPSGGFLFRADPDPSGSTGGNPPFAKGAPLRTTPTEITPESFPKRLGARCYVAGGPGSDCREGSIGLAGSAAR